MRIVHITHSDLIGGAARAATRLHKSLVRGGVDSWMVVNQRLGMDERTILHSKSLPTRIAQLAATPATFTMRRYNIRQYGVYSTIGLVGSGMLKTALELNPDIIHLHWIGSESISIEELGAIRIPVVWTLHDMWPMCGALHYDQDNEQTVWRDGVESWREIFEHSQSIVERFTWMRKHRSWQNLDLHLVAPSHWIAHCSKQSRLLGRFPARVIPCALDTEVFRPRKHLSARAAFDLPPDRPIILFGSLNGLTDSRKGGDLLIEGLRLLPKRTLDARPILCIFGQQPSDPAPDIGLEFRTVSPITDDERLSLLYSVCDVMIVPSVQEAFGQTGSEAQACGCPVVTVDTSGTTDLVEHKTSGFLCQGRSPDRLAKGIAWVLEDEARRRELGKRARERAVELWSYAAVSNRHTAFYEEILHKVRTS